MTHDLRFDDPDRLRIAIAGRTNSGKTTLVRSLLRSPVGEIADRANVTEWPDYYMDDELGVILVDCPGFQDAGRYRAYRLLKPIDPQMAETIRGTTNFAFETRAVEAIEACNLIVYMASLEDIPMAPHQQELELLRESGPVVGLLNKGRLAEKAQDHAAARERVRQWSHAFNEAGVPWTEYDAHDSPPDALRRVYELLAAHVTVGQAERMRSYIQNLAHRAATQRHRVAREFARRVVALRGQSIIVTLPREGYTPKKGEQAGAEALLGALGQSLDGFVAHCAEVYGFRHHFEQGRLSFDPSVRQSLMEGGPGTAILGTLYGANAGATLGVMLFVPLGALAGLFVAGPAGAWAAAEALTGWAAGLGGLAGGIGGATWGFHGDREATVTIPVDAPILAEYAGLATAWAAALAYRGFGKGEDVGLDSMEELRPTVRAVLEQAPAMNLATASEDALHAWMSRNLERLGI